MNRHIIIGSLLTMAGLIFIAGFQNCAGTSQWETQSTVASGGGAAAPGGGGTPINPTKVLADTVLNFTFSEAANPAKYVDSSGLNNNATCVKAKCPKNKIAGKMNSSIDFSSAESLSVPNTESLNPAQFSLEVWVRIASNVGAGTEPMAIVSKATDKTFRDGYGLYFTPAGRKLTFYVNDALVAANTVTAPGVNLGEYLHVVGTYDGKKITLYVDGEIVGGSAIAKAIDHSRQDFEIGAVNEARGFRGVIDEVVLYKVAIAQDAVRARFTANSGSYEKPVIDFGGAFGAFATGTFYVNPFFTSSACPPKFTQTRVLGTANIDWEFSFCHQKHSYITKSTGDFGGFYGKVNTKVVNNPFSNNAGCPAGFTVKTVWGANNLDELLYICHRPHVDGNPSPYLFGGMYGIISKTQKVNNPVTNTYGCPAGYTALQVSGNTARPEDLELFYCHAKRTDIVFTSGTGSGVLSTGGGTPVPTPKPTDAPPPPPPDTCEAHGWHSGATGLPGNCPNAACGQECRKYQGSIGGHECWAVLSQPPTCR